MHAFSFFKYLMSCIYVYYPNKPIPSWLVEIKFLEAQIESNPHVLHDGFGIVVSLKGKYFSYLARGNFIKLVRCNGVSLNLNQDLHMSFKSFFTATRSNINNGERA